MKEIKKVEIKAFDPYDADAMLDALLQLKFKQDEIINVVNDLTIKQK